MNKLDFTLQGGDPLTLDNLEYFQNSIKDALKGLGSVLQPIPNIAVILSGITLVTSGGGGFSYTEGYVYMNGEVCFCPASIAFTAGQLPFFDINQTFDTAGDEVFEDLITKSTYLKREARLALSTGSSTEIDFANSTTLKKTISFLGFLLDKSTAWSNLPTLATHWSVPGPFLGTTNVAKYRKNETGCVELKGIILTNNLVTTSEPAFTLPVGFRPADPRVFLVAGLQTHCEVIVNQNGIVEVRLESGSTGLVSLEGIRFDV